MASLHHFASDRAEIAEVLSSTLQPSSEPEIVEQTLPNLSPRPQIVLPTATSTTSTQASLGDTAQSFSQSTDLELKTFNAPEVINKETSHCSEDQDLNQDLQNRSARYIIQAVYTVGSHLLNFQRQFSHLQILLEPNTEDIVDKEGNRTNFSWHRFINSLPIDVAHDHLFALHFKSLFRFENVNRRSELLASLAQSEITSWAEGFCNRQFAFAIRTNSFPRIRRFKIKGTKAQRHLWFTMELFSRMRAAYDMLQQPLVDYRFVKDVQGTELQTVAAEFFGHGNYTTTYDQNFRLELDKFLSEAGVTQFLTHIIMNNMLIVDADRDHNVDLAEVRHVTSKSVNKHAELGHAMRCMPSMIEVLEAQEPVVIEQNNKICPTTVDMVTAATSQEPDSETLENLLKEVELASVNKETPKSKKHGKNKRKNKKKKKKQALKTEFAPESEVENMIASNDEDEPREAFAVLCGKTAADSDRSKNPEAQETKDRSAIIAVDNIIEAKSSNKNAGNSAETNKSEVTITSPSNIEAKSKSIKAPHQLKAEDPVISISNSKKPDHLQLQSQNSQKSKGTNSPPRANEDDSLAATKNRLKQQSPPPSLDQVRGQKASEKKQRRDSLNFLQSRASSRAASLDKLSSPKLEDHQVEPESSKKASPVADPHIVALVEKLRAQNQLEDGHPGTMSSPQTHQMQSGQPKTPQTKTPQTQTLPAKQKSKTGIQKDQTARQLPAPPSLKNSGEVANNASPHFTSSFKNRAEERNLPVNTPAGHHHPQHGHNTPNANDFIVSPTSHPPFPSFDNNSSRSGYQGQSGAQPPSVASNFVNQHVGFNFSGSNERDNRHFQGSFHGNYQPSGPFQPHPPYAGGYSGPIRPEPNFNRIPTDQSTPLGHLQGSAYGAYQSPGLFQPHPPYANVYSGPIRPQPNFNHILTDHGIPMVHSSNNFTGSSALGFRASSNRHNHYNSGRGDYPPALNHSARPPMQYTQQPIRINVPGYGDGMGRYGLDQNGFMSSEITSAANQPDSYVMAGHRNLGLGYYPPAAQTYDPNVNNFSGPVPFEPTLSGPDIAPQYGHENATSNYVSEANNHNDRAQDNDHTSVENHIGSGVIDTHDTPVVVVDDDDDDDVVRYYTPRLRRSNEHWRSSSDPASYITTTPVISAAVDSAPAPSSQDLRLGSPPMAVAERSYSDAGN